MAPKKLVEKSDQLWDPLFCSFFAAQTPTNRAYKVVKEAHSGMGVHQKAVHKACAPLSKCVFSGVQCIWAVD